MLQRVPLVFLITIQLIALAVLNLSCSHFERPDFKGPEYSTTHEYVGPKELTLQGEFSTPEELYQSNQLLKTEPSQAPKGEFRLQWPVDLITINRGYIESGRRSHLGLDLGGRRNTPILAAHDGTVVYAGSGFRGFGKLIILEFDDTWASLYGHLNKFKVKTGQKVLAGQVIGFMGRTGRATGVHLHFELMKDKVPVDPLQFLSLDDRGLAAGSSGTAGGK